MSNQLELINSQSAPQLWKIEIMLLSYIWLNIHELCKIISDLSEQSFHGLHILVLAKKVGVE